MAKKDEKGYWFTTENGNHIHVGEGETPKSATEKFVKKVQGEGGVKKQSKADDFDNDYDEEFKAYDDELGEYLKEKYDVDPNGKAYIEDARNIIEKIGTNYGEIREHVINGLEYGDLEDDQKRALLNVVAGLLDSGEYDSKDNEYEEENTEWGNFANSTDKKVKEYGWTPNGFDGDTRFYHTNGSWKGLEEASVNPNGYTELYTKNGVIGFSTMKDVIDFLNTGSKEKAEDFQWDKNGGISETEDRAIADLYGEGNQVRDKDISEALEDAPNLMGDIEDQDLDEITNKVSNQLGTGKDKVKKVIDNEKPDNFDNEMPNKYNPTNEMTTPKFASNTKAYLDKLYKGNPTPQQENAIRRNLSNDLDNLNDDIDEWVSNKSLDQEKLKETLSAYADTLKNEMGRYPNPINGKAFDLQRKIVKIIKGKNPQKQDDYDSMSKEELIKLLRKQK